MFVYNIQCTVFDLNYFIGNINNNILTPDLYIDNLILLLTVTYSIYSQIKDLIHFFLKSI